MNLLGQVFKWILSVAGIGSLLILFMMIFRKLMKKKVQSRFLNILWILILVKLVIPINIETNFNMESIISGGKETISSRENAQIVDERVTKRNRNNFIVEDKEIVNNDKFYKLSNKVEDVNKKTQANIETKKNLINSNNIKYIWFLGALLMSTILIYTRIKLSLEISKSKKISERKILEIFKESKETLNIKRNIDLYTGDMKESPFIIGLLRPKIYLPRYAIDSLDEEQINHILLHELSHYKRGDILFNTLQTIALILHWFNPLVWISMQLIKNDRELACDDYVMDVLGEENIIDYGYTLIELAKFSSFNKNNLVSIHFADDNNQTKRRVEMVKEHEGMSMGKKIIIGVLALGIGLFILTQAKGNAFEEGIFLEQEEDREMIVDTEYKEFPNLEEAKPYINGRLKIPEKLPDDFKLKSISIDESETDVLSLMYSAESKGDYMTLRIKDKDQDSTIYNMPPVDERSESNVIREDKLTIGGKEVNRIDIEEINSDVGVSGKDNFQVKYQNMLIRYHWEENGLDYWLDRNTNPDSHKLMLEKEEEIIDKDHIKIFIDSLKPIEDINLVEASGRSEEDKVYDDLQVYSKKDMEKAIDILGYDPKIQDYQDKNFKFTNISVQDSGGQGKNIYFNADKKAKDGKMIQLMIVIDGFMDNSKLDEMNKNGYYEYKQLNKKPEKIEAELLPILGSDVFKAELSMDDVPVESKEYIWRHSRNNKVYKAEFFINSEEDLEFLNEGNKEKGSELYRNPTEEEQLEIVRELVK